MIQYKHYGFIGDPGRKDTTAIEIQSERGVGVEQQSASNLPRYTRTEGCGGTPTASLDTVGMRGDITTFRLYVSQLYNH